VPPERCTVPAADSNARLRGWDPRCDADETFQLDCIFDNVTHRVGMYNSARQRRSVMVRQPRTLAGKVVVITGGGRGIGAATASALARLGAQVAIGDLDQDVAKRTADGLGENAVALPMD